MSYKNPEDERTRKKLHYNQHSSEYKARAKASKVKLRSLLDELKKGPCMDCGKRFPTVCMDFDHRDPSTKKHNVSRMTVRGSERLLLDEIAKCDLVCANCHRVRSAKVWGRSRED